MAVAIAYDVTRLFLGPLSRTPRGIDRVDLMLARELFTLGRSDAVGVLPTPWGVRTYDAERVRRGLDCLETLWAERHSVDDDPTWFELRARLLSQSSAAASTPQPLSTTRRLQRILSLIKATGFALGRPVARDLPPRAVYLNVGQISLALPMLFRWLARRPDVPAVMMLHDVIPLAVPQFVSPSSVRHHARMVRTAARYADGLIVTTAYAQSTVSTALAAERPVLPPILARHLPVAPVFRRKAPEEADIVDRPYFVVCGTIEPRKNHALLQSVWRRLIDRLGDSVPHLVVAGSPGWASGAILAGYRQTEPLRRCVHVVAGLSSPALARLLVGARGLLMPSHAEGFGLPLVEARRLGVPVIASSIPPHREICGAEDVLLAPDDIAGWEAVILSWLSDGRPSIRAEVGIDSPETYARAVFAFARGCAPTSPLRYSWPSTTMVGKTKGMRPQWPS